MASLFQTQTLTLTQHHISIPGSVFCLFQQSLLVVVALAASLRDSPSMQKIASAAFYYMHFLHNNPTSSLLFMAFVCPWTMFELERSQKQESNWHFVYRLKIVKREEKKVRTRKTSSSAVFSRSSSTKRTVAIAAAVIVGLSTATLAHSFTCCFFFAREKTKETQRINTVSTDILLARFYPFSLCRARFALVCFIILFSAPFYLIYSSFWLFKMMHLQWFLCRDFVFSSIFLCPERSHSTIPFLCVCALSFRIFTVYLWKPSFLFKC